MNIGDTPDLGGGWRREGEPGWRGGGGGSRLGGISALSF